MSGGMEFMLKSLGIDPDEIRKQVAQFGQLVVDLKTQMDRIEAKLDIALEHDDDRSLSQPAGGVGRIDQARECVGGTKDRPAQS